ncbi:MAG: hypothetical protein QM723_17010 [Myxococcaceae bacterium]
MRTQEVFAADDGRELRDELERTQAELARSQKDAIRNQESIANLQHQVEQQKRVVAQEHQKLEEAIAEHAKLRKELGQLKGRKAAAQRRIIRKYIGDRLWWLWVLGTALVLGALAVAMGIMITHGPPSVRDTPQVWRGRKF